MFKKKIKYTEIDLTESTLIGFQLAKQLVESVLDIPEIWPGFVTTKFHSVDEETKSYQFVMSIRCFTCTNTVYISFDLSKQNDPVQRNIYGIPIKTWQLKDAASILIEGIGFDKTLFFEKHEDRFVPSPQKEGNLEQVELFKQRLEVIHSFNS